MTTPTEPDYREHYEQGRERDRLFRGHGHLERVRTQELLARHLPPPPAVILDVGGGPGVYTSWLGEQGCEAHLADPVPLHVEQAGEEPSIASARVGDARSLEQPDDSVDAVLLLGPLYHLTAREDRICALREAMRVVRPGGIVFALGISRFAALFDGLASGLLKDPAAVRIVERDLRDGQHRNPDNNPRYFTTAYFHHPSELPEEVREADLSVVETVGIEGPGHWMAQDFDAWWNGAALREHLLNAARVVEHEPSLMGLSPHLMTIARKTA